MQARAFRQSETEREPLLRLVTDAELEDFDYEAEEWEGDPKRRPEARREAKLRRQQLRAKYGRC